MKKQTLLAIIFSLVTAWSLAADDDLYKQFQPKESSHVPEGIEWSTSYAFNAPDNEKPRLLLVGDSIANGYNGAVRDRLGDKMNMTFWASSRCVTAPDYFAQLSQILSANRYTAISFNNGLHSLSADLAEWETAYRAAVKFIRAKCPDAKLYLTLSTPLKDPELTKKSRKLNEIVLKIAGEENLPTIDLFGLMDPLDRNEFWSDTFHFKGPAIEKQAEKIVETVTK